MRHFLSFFFFLCFFGQVVTAVAQITPGSVYKISTSYTGNRVLTVKNSSLNDNDSVFLWTETGVNSQRWRAVDAGEGKFYLENAYTGKRLQAQNANSIIQKGLGTTNDFKWSFEEVIGYTNTYYINNALRPGYLEVLNGKNVDNDGSPLRFYAQSATPELRQMWKIELADDTPNQLTPAMRTAMMQAWKARYFSWLKNSNGFWGEAECMEIILDAYETTGLEEYKLMFEEVYAHFVSGSGGWGTTNGKNWMWNEFNDDVAWAVLASIRAYFMFGTHPDSSINYLNIARTNFDSMYSRGLYKIDGLYYLLRWKQGQEGTTSCVNGPAEIAACYLGIATGVETYFEKAKMLYANQRIHMYEPSTGRVYDSFENNWASAYNQGTYLGAALMLYNKYGDEIYKNDAEKIMEFSRNNLSNSNGIITSVDSESGDYVSFKAILLRYVRRFVADLGKTDAGEWLQKNTVHAYNNRNSRGISRLTWVVKTGETDDWNSIGAFAAVAVAMNAPMDINTIYKNAFSTIKAGSFNYISKVFSENVTDGENLEITSIEDGAYLGYNLISCENDFATSVRLEISNNVTERTVEVRLDSPKGALLATITIPTTVGNSWTTIQADLEQQLTGRNNIYLVFKGTKNNLRFKSFKFISGGTNYGTISAADITDDGGELSSQYAGVGSEESLEKLTDNAVGSKYLVSQSNLWVQYKAAKKYTLRLYTISAANDSPDKDPRAWTLLGSTNGTSWDVLDTRLNQTFGEREATLEYPINATKAYQYFKLDITANNGSADTQLSEWQLFGDEYLEDYYHDFIETGTLFSEGVDPELLATLSDNDPATFCSLNAEELPVIIQFNSPVPIQMLGYNITSSGENSASDPKAWTLRASSNGTTWTTVDSRTNQSFDNRNLKKVFDRSSSTEYSYFRLEITALKDVAAKDVKIAEWELNGFYINKYDMTSDPKGIITAQWEGKYKAEDNVDERFYKLIDNNKAGKYLVSYRKTFWTTYESARPAKLFAYSLTSANDAPNRDPKSWTLYGSNNNSKWTVIDKQENQQFLYRYATMYYLCAQESKFRYFKLDVESNSDEKNVQLAEWQLFGEFNDYPTDITDNGGTLTSSHVATGGTTLDALIDNNESSKFYLDITNADFGEGIWFNYVSPEPVIMSSYVLTSSNDNPNNDPKDWKLQGSNDGIGWTDLDSRSSIVFDSRCERKEFLISTTSSFRQIRLFVTARQSLVRGFQLAEWELFGTTVAGLGSIDVQSTRIYPNPADKFITVNALNDGILEIYGIEGNKIYNQEVIHGDVSIRVESLPKGLYFVKIKSQHVVETGKFIKQ